MKAFAWYMGYAVLFLLGYVFYVFQMHNGFEVFIILSSLTIVLNILSQININKKYKNTIKDIKEYEYWNEVEFPNIEPIHAGFLLNKTSIDINGIIATIFLLEKKGIFNIEIQGDKYFIGLNKIEKTVIDELQTYEQKIVKLLFTSIDDERKIDLAEEISSIKKDPDKRIAINKICRAEQDNASYKFYKSSWQEMTTLQETLYGVLAVHSLFGFFIILAAFYTTLIIPVIVAYLLQLTLMIYMGNRKQLYFKYVDEVNRLQGLYNYLIEYSTIKDKEIKYSKLYEKFFLYAVGLGIADKFEKEFNQGNIENEFITDIQLLIKNSYFGNK